MEVPIASAVVKLAASGALWVFGDTKSTVRGRVAAYYRAAALECRDFDRFFGQQVHNPLFSISNSARDENIGNHGEPAITLADTLTKLIFAVLATIEVVDTRTANLDDLLAPNMISKINDALDKGKERIKRLFLSSNKFKNAEQYFDAMRLSDLTLLPVLKALRRRAKLTVETAQLSSWEDFKENHNLKIASTSHQYRAQLANELEKRLDALHLAAQKTSPTFFTNGVEDVVVQDAELGILRTFFNEAGDIITEEYNKRFEALLRDKLCRENRVTNLRLGKQPNAE